VRLHVLSNGIVYSHILIFVFEKRAFEFNFSPFVQWIQHGTVLPCFVVQNNHDDNGCSNDVRVETRLTKNDCATRDRRDEPSGFDLDSTPVTANVPTISSQKSIEQRRNRRVSCDSGSRY